ncbi:thioesterase II family protein [Chitinophaga rhizophila]|uniref:Alpha/beta fold hydrolase n=1 Tax=Chitinophaga rhizophila TaxID=2866212 RepID=A0ABS7GHJ0_9BACT|nr:alpha/beta fold hydrolase [Chitinophaga rhizophila]MBW8687173.1 alpha/beta fold hydrolase [Chitinophaga rhizophila]
MQIFLLHFAGGNCYSFDFLRKQMDKDMKFLPLELPGRGKRYRESLLADKPSAIKDYVAAIRRQRNKEAYLIYGHSMGATLGLSVVKELEVLGDPPIALIVSGNAGPGLKYHEGPKRYLMNDEDFLQELVKLGGVPQEFLESAELYEHFAPILRADFETLEKDEDFEAGTKIQAPIYAIMGDEEKLADRIDNWKNFTLGHFDKQVLPGNHFFIHQHAAAIAAIIKQCCMKYSSPNSIVRCSS